MITNCYLILTTQIWSNQRDVNVCILGSYIFQAYYFQSQMYSGLRCGTRIAQGEYIKMTLKAEVAVQIDGEPWMQPPGKIVISVSPQQVCEMTQMSPIFVLSFMCNLHVSSVC